LTTTLHARDPTAGDAIAGVAPQVVFEPHSREECAEIFRSGGSRRLALAVVGGGTELGLGAPPTRLDAVVSTRRLDRVIEYAPSDQIVVVEAGMTLSALQHTLAQSRQRLAYDPPLADRATIGGLLATNNFGPLRTRFGSLRDLIIGVSILRVDGSFAHGGGKVVKNVAGFDLPKLIVGALGTLGMIASATFRLHPLPEAETTMRIGGLAACAVRALVVRMRSEQLEPAAVVALSAGDGFDVLVRFEGFTAGVREQRDRAAVLVHQLEGSDAPRTRPAAVDELSTPEADAAWNEHAARRTAGNARVKLSALPAAMPAVASEVVPILTGALSGGRAVGYPTLGLGFVTGDVEDGAAFAEAVVRARASLAPGHGSLVVQELPISARGAVDLWGPAPAALGLMKRVKERFDPDNRLNPGRFVGGL
jgi:glycolate dehydrogenase FAD-binding subunit